MLVLAHVSDIHVDGTEVRNERATRVMRYLDSLSTPVDAILLTGDIADHGLPEEYDEARKLLAGTSPVLPCPGNHDDRSAYRSAFLGVEPSTDPINEVHHVGGVVLAMCDSTIPGEDGGYLADETLPLARPGTARSRRRRTRAGLFPPPTRHAGAPLRRRHPAGRGGPAR